MLIYVGRYVGNVESLGNKGWLLDEGRMLKSHISFLDSK